MLKFNSFPPVLTAMTVFFLSACSTGMHQAPVEDRRSAVVPQEVAAIPVVPNAKIIPPKPVESVRGTYVVKRGDTLYKIALDHGRNYTDLVLWNGLKNPNDIKVDQILKIAPPETVASLNAAQTTPVASPVLSEAKPLQATTNTVVTMGGASNKSIPRGDKRAYSESVYAELQKSDPGQLATSGIAQPITTAALSKLPEKSIENASVNDTDNIDWMWPVDSKPSALFDEGKNKGLDFSGKLGQDIHAAGSGRVMYVGSGIRGYGNLVILRHSNNLLSAYAHNKTIVVKEGQNVTKGQKIAEMGNSDSDTIKLHFEIRLNGKSIDPARYLPPR
ncbi:peptidoglycan DD-metalloendopeptidase family protein [Undibacterium luofuense]|nr:peptidoglycan DD-metalloendopeptidase family protein [Undibacterium luofuense]